MSFHSGHHRKSKFLAFKARSILIVLACMLFGAWVMCFAGRLCKIGPVDVDHGAVPELGHEEELKCFDAHGYDIGNPQAISYKSEPWSKQSDLSIHADFLSDSILQVKYTAGYYGDTGRNFIYRRNRNATRYDYVGKFTEYDNFKGIAPKVYPIPGTDWLVSEEYVGSGTGYAEYWYRFWLLKESGLVELFALPARAHEALSTAQPWKSHEIRILKEKCSNQVLQFRIHSKCAIFYGDEGVDDPDLKEFELPEISREFCYKLHEPGCRVEHVVCDLSMTRMGSLHDPSMPRSMFAIVTK